MKSLKLIVMLAIVGGGANAATITLTQGFGAQGFTVLVGGVAPASFFWAAGNYDTLSSTWTQFGTSILDTAKANGTVTSTSPASLNNSLINIFIGSGTDIASSGSSWVILGSTSATLFPPDVTAATNVTFAAANTNTVTFVAKGDTNNGFTAPVGATGGNLNLVTIPEPSAALLGALGALGLLRRRRI